MGEILNQINPLPGGSTALIFPAGGVSLPISHPMVGGPSRWALSKRGDTLVHPGKNCPTNNLPQGFADLDLIGHQSLGAQALQACQRHRG